MKLHFELNRNHYGNAHVWKNKQISGYLFLMEAKIMSSVLSISLLKCSLKQVSKNQRNIISDLEETWETIRLALPVSRWGKRFFSFPHLCNMFKFPNGIISHLANAHGVRPHEENNENIIYSIVPMLNRSERIDLLFIFFQLINQSINLTTINK